MYGTVVRLRIVSGKEEEFLDHVRAYDEIIIPGRVGSHLYRLDTGNNEYMQAVLFTDKEAYVANASSGDQQERYQQMRALLVDDPEWNDGEVHHSYIEEVRSR